VTDQEDASHEYWILAAYRNQNGGTDDVPVGEGQLFSWTAAQVAIKRAQRLLRQIDLVCTADHILTVFAIAIAPPV